MSYRLTAIQEQAGPFVFNLYTLENFESAIDAMFAELEARGSPQLLEELCPYFGTLWPAGRLLGRWIANQGAAFSGRRVLELGCGLALPSLVASRLGAEVTASDLHPDVPHFLARNLLNNPECSVRYRHLDWRNPPRSLGQFDWVLGSDVLYEAEQADSLVSFLKATLTPEGKAVIIDPDRSYWNRLVDLARSKGLRVQIAPLEPTQPGDPARAILLCLARK